MKAQWNMRSVTTTPLRAIVVIAVIVVAGSSATIAFAAIGDGGTVATYVNTSNGTWRIVTTGSCKPGEQSLVLYTKSGADAAFLTKTVADAAYCSARRRPPPTPISSTARTPRSSSARRTRPPTPTSSTAKTTSGVRDDELHRLPTPRHRLARLRSAPRQPATPPTWPIANLSAPTSAAPTCPTPI